MSDYYETDLLIWENKQDTLHREWGEKYKYASIEGFKNRGKKESDIIFLEWGNDLDEVLENINTFQQVDKLKIRVTKYKRIHT
tara:strand:+ start:4237 stop:4485 length:249 start_codon:yes stop_codon:yes gene_type:complete